MTCRLLPTHRLRGVVLGLIAAPLLPGVALAAPPVPTGSTHPIAAATQAGADETALQYGRYGYGSGAPPLPVSKVLSLSDGSALYSREVNRILCADSDSRTGQTWLGNGLGVKRIDRKAGVVRHYGQSDGLPVGRVVAVAADSSGQAWCIVQGQAVPAPPGQRAAPSNVSRVRVHLCTFTPSGRSVGGKWSVLRTIAPLSDSYNNGMGYYPYNGSSDGANGEATALAGRPRIVVGAATVLFTLGALGATEKTAVYQWDRRVRTFQDISWETGLRTDNRLLLATFVASDKRDGALWIGTNVGLLHRSAATAKAASPVWTRLLADRIVSEGAAAKTGDGIWVVTTPRDLRDNSSVSPSRFPYGFIDWKVFRVTGIAVSQRRDVTPPLAPAGTPVRTGMAMPVPFRGEGTNTNIPLALTIDAAGALWLTQRGSNPGRPQFSPSGLDAWWRRDPKTAAWTHFDMRGANLSGFGGRQSLYVRETQPDGTVLRDNLGDTAIPDLAIRSLTLTAAGSYGGYYSSGYTVDGYSVVGAADNPGAALWLQRRFPGWICADDITDRLGGTRGGYGFALPGGGLSLGPIPDPAGPPGRVWVVDLAGTSLLRLPAYAVPIDLQRARSQGILTYATGTPPIRSAAAETEQFAFPAGQTIQVRPSIAVLVKGGENRLFLTGQNQELYAFDTAAGTFSRVSLPGNAISPTRYNPPVATEDGDLLLSSPNYSNAQVIRYSHGDQSFRVVTDPGQGGRVFGIAPNGGLWIVANRIQLQFLPPGQTVPVALPDEMKAAQNGYQSTIAATGYIGWSIPSGGLLVGYDIERKRQTPPIDLQRRDGYGYGSRGLTLQTDKNGAVYTASEDGVAAVYRYDREKNAWETAAPPLPPFPKTDNSQLPAPILALADDHDLWVLAEARFLLRYDRATKKWDDPIPLPETMRGDRSSESDLSITAAENGAAFYLGGRAGFWRYDRKANVWSEKRLPTPLIPPGSNPGYTRVTALAVTPNSAFTVWSSNTSTAVAARLDRKTKAWTVYDESKGFPERGTIRRLIGTGSGSGAWILHDSGTYFFDEKRDRWRLAFGGNASRSSEQAPPMAAREGNPNPTEDTGDQTVADIVIDPKTGDSFVLANPRNDRGQGRTVLFRCDRDGRIIARSEIPAQPGAGTSVQGNALLMDSGSVLVATSAGVLRTSGGTNSRWERIVPPAGLPAPSNITRLQRDTEGRGLYVMNSDTVAFWRFQ